MARCRIDKSIERVEMGGFAFPLGVYPIEPMEPRVGYTVTFEPADGDNGVSPGGGSDADEAAGDDEGGLADAGAEGSEWEEWPDRYVFDILVPATRVEALCRSLFALLPGRVYPILDVLGQDEFREIDPYVAYDLVGLEQFLDAVRRFNGFFYEDGLAGFGVMCEEPFLYILVDEHKYVLVRAETALREKVEAVLAAFDLTEVDEIAGADAATHEHRGVLDAPDDRPDLLNAEEIVEYLRDKWHLVLNIDPESNVDDEGSPLGVTGWRCLLRHDWEIPPNEAEAAKAAHQAGKPPAVGRYAEIYLTAGCFREAEDLSLEELKNLLSPALRKIWEQDEDAPDVPILVAADRLTVEHFQEEIERARRQAKSDKKSAKLDMAERRVWFAGWLPLET